MIQARKNSVKLAIACLVAIVIGSVVLFANKYKFDGIKTEARHEKAWVVLAREEIAKDVKISSDLIEINLLEAKSVPQDALWNPSMAIGFKATCIIPKGRILRTTDVGINPKLLPDFGLSKWPRLDKNGHPEISP